MNSQNTGTAMRESMRAVYLMLGSIGACALVMLAAVVWTTAGVDSTALAATLLPDITGSLC